MRTRISVRARAMDRGVGLAAVVLAGFIRLITHPRSYGLINPLG